MSISKDIDPASLRTLPDDAIVTWNSGVRHLIPISKNAWIAGWQAGRYPKPIKIGPRLNGWQLGTIRKLLDDLAKQGG